MQVKTSVHESVQNQISEGLPATIRIDAVNDRSYAGSVKSIGVLPDQGSWHNSDTKMYETYVTIDENVEQLKPGMTAIVEIHVDRIDDILTVPVQAVQQVDESTFLYVERSGRVQRQEVETGRTNDKLVEINSGVNDNDRVVLNPLAVVE
jgi:HlyD family secretion protein